MKAGRWLFTTIAVVPLFCMWLVVNGDHGSVSVVDRELSAQIWGGACANNYFHSLGDHNCYQNIVQDCWPNGCRHCGGECPDTSTWALGGTQQYYADYFGTVPCYQYQPWPKKCTAVGCVCIDGTPNTFNYDCGGFGPSYAQCPPGW